MPIPANAEIEGYPKAGGAGDKHVLVLDRDNCFLYELYKGKLQVTLRGQPAPALFGI